MVIYGYVNVVGASSMTSSEYIMLELKGPWFEEYVVPHGHQACGQASTCHPQSPQCFPHTLWRPCSPLDGQDEYYVVACPFNLLNHAHELLKEGSFMNIPSSLGSRPSSWLRLIRSIASLAMAMPLSFLPLLTLCESILSLSNSP